MHPGPASTALGDDVLDLREELKKKVAVRTSYSTRHEPDDPDGPETFF